MDEFVSVSVRIRPCFNETEIPNSCLQVINKHPAVLLVLDKSQAYSFDNIFADDVTQEDIYNDTVKRLVEKVKSGYNCTVFAYGQTGTGKTYTVGTNPDSRNEDEAGLISRTLKDFFCSIDEDSEIEVEISFIEIYNEKVFDLLTPDNKCPLSVKGFKVQGSKKVRVFSALEALQHLKYGTGKRHTGGTKQNLNSSRSHAIFSIYCCTRNSEKETMAKLNLVDLAGSESVRKTGNKGSSFFEGININKGLLSLGQVMTALSTNSSHIPYRQSIVTTILQDSLNKKNYVSLIACVSSNPEDLGETLQTLEFSNRVKRMKNKPEMNEFMLQYRKENPSLFTNNIKGVTPLKRSIGCTYETPFKRPKNVLPLIREPSSVNSSNFDISPLFSSTMTSAVSETPQNFSPVIRKYINKMEASIMTKLENVIKSTLQRPRASPRIKDKENFAIPSLPWNNCPKNNSLDLVSDENTVIDSSLDEKSGVSKNIQSPESTKIGLRTNDEEKEAEEKHFVFKVPAPKSKETIKENSVRRSSVRLQMKKRVSQVTTENIVKRRSVRIQLRKSHVANNAIEEISPSLEINKRRSVRLQLKNINTNIKDTTETISPCKNCLNKKHQTSRKSKQLKDSPITRRNKIVLDILNNGNIRKLETLHTVGTKTAEKILLFRQLHGQFKSISDVGEMPYWGKKKFDKFMAENFLKM